MIATVFLVGGFVLAIVGIALWSMPAALVTAGLVLFISGGLEESRRTAARAAAARKRAIADAANMK